jgi:hypothetical protein
MLNGPASKGSHTSRGDLSERAMTWHDICLIVISIG